MRIRALLVLLLGVGLAGGSVALTHAWLKRDPAPGEAQAALPGAELVSIAMARTDIPFGRQVTPDLVKLQSWPKEALPTGAFSSMEELLGGQGAEPRRVRRAIAAGEPLIQSKLSGFGEKVTIADVIDPTKRAVAIRVDDVTGVAGFVTPGDRVDIILTRTLQNQDMRADTILQNIVVRGTDQVVDQDRDKPTVVRTITVEVDPEEAQKLTLAQQAGKLSLLLRNLGTDELMRLPVMRTSDLAPDPQAAAAPPPPDVHVAAPPQVRVVRAGERTTVVLPR